MTYYVTFRIDGRYVVQVDAPDAGHAVVQATHIFCDANLNEMETIDVEPVIVEDEHGEIIDEL